MVRLVTPPCDFAASEGVVETVVVGLIGSACDWSALDFAGREAATRGAKIRVIATWRMPCIVEPELWCPTELFEGLRQQADTVVRNALERIREFDSSITGEGKAFEGHLASILPKQSQDASLIVLARRAQGLFGSLVAGSIARRVVKWAPCPVVAVSQNGRTFTYRKGSSPHPRP